MTSLGYTGPRDGMGPLQREALVTLLRYLDLKDPITAIHHGDCVGGDEQFDALVDDILLSNPMVSHCGITRYIHPGPGGEFRAYCEKNARHYIQTILSEPQPHLTRNRHVVQACTVLIGTPGREDWPGAFGGTVYTIEHSIKIKKPTLVITPSGHVSRYHEKTS